MLSTIFYSSPIITTCVISGYTYSLIGNVFKILNDKKQVDKSIRYSKNIDLVYLTISNSVYQPPMYVNSGNGISIPFGSGNRNEDTTIYSFVKLYSFDKKKTIFKIHEDLIHQSYDVTYLNTKDDINKLLKKYNIPENDFPHIVPIKVWTKKYNNNKKVYFNYYCVSQNKNYVRLVSHFEKRLPLTVTILCGSGLLYFMKDYI